MSFAPTALSVLFLAASSACSSSLRPRAIECSGDVSSMCAERCLRHEEARKASPEGRCEATVGELCRAQCLADCDDDSAALASRIAELDQYLERQCGSGQPVESGEVPADHRAPTPSPLNGLLE
jgi:hypothetical protein